MASRQPPSARAQASGSAASPEAQYEWVPVSTKVMTVECPRFATCQVKTLLGDIDRLERHVLHTCGGIPPQPQVDLYSYLLSKCHICLENRTDGVRHWVQRQPKAPQATTAGGQLRSFKGVGNLKFQIIPCPFCRAPLVFNTVVKTHLDGGACVSAASETKNWYTSAGQDARKGYIETWIKLERLDAAVSRNGRQIHNFQYTYPAPNAPLPPIPAPSRPPSRRPGDTGSPRYPPGTPAARSPSVARTPRPPSSAEQSPSPVFRGRTTHATARQRRPSQTSQTSRRSSVASSRASSVEGAVHQAIASNDRFLRERRQLRDLGIAFQREKTPNF